jgi:hypothetical protein
MYKYDATSAEYNDTKKYIEIQKILLVACHILYLQRAISVACHISTHRYFEKHWQRGLEGHTTTSSLPCHATNNHIGSALRPHIAGI